MNLINNIQNGGLVCRDGSTLIAGQVSRGRGMNYYQVIGDFTQEEVMPWFMNKIHEEIYYSNALNEDNIWKVDLNTNLHQCVLKEPSYLLQYEEEVLYYINEDTREICSYSLREKENKSLVNEEILTFNILGGRLWYSTEKGLFSCQKDGSGKEKLGDSQAIRLIGSLKGIAFIDRARDYQIGQLDLMTGKVNYISDTAATTLNGEGDYLFYNHHNDRGHLYRYDTNSGFGIKFVPERADYLHIEGKMLYYFNLDEQSWKKIETKGGRPISIDR